MQEGGEMARYKDYSYEQTKLIPISFHHQILPGTFEYTLNYLIDNEVDLSLFEQRYRNDETGAPAYDPAVLLICDEMGLIGREMFAIDGCKMPSNASKEWSGTKAELRRKQKKMERAARYLVEKHREMDIEAGQDPVVDKERQQIETLRARVKKLKSWLKENDEKWGKTGPKKSNLTDNESAKMKSSHGVIQGYDGVAA